MQKEKVIIIGAGPCGMSCAIELQQRGLDPLLIEKDNVVNSIYNYPTHQTFFSSSDKLEIGGVPFITEKQKPVRNQALSYYRTVAQRKELRIHTYEEVRTVENTNGTFIVHTDKEEYESSYVVMATGYYDQPNYMGVPGEELEKVMHYFKEAHPYFNKRVVVIGGKNSAVDATLELHKAGAEVTVLYRGSEYSKSIKPWILPEFDSLVKKEAVHMEFNATVERITNDSLIYNVDGETFTIENDFVFAMTGYLPDYQLLKDVGISIEENTGSPVYNINTMETNVEGMFVAGVVAAGYNNNKIFIENGRFHGATIAEEIMGRISQA
ncbi:YpdA family putative bacillithiol disulfide reductase [Virgibacillus xinjiangensis]|uniref:YpdA family putative bacillithiol disulfide reductase n=1 Tax=Virgibacillus xinjiangensis TaxID=393090 RepID=A0ABV7CRH5_9BACI